MLASLTTLQPADRFGFLRIDDELSVLHPIASGEFGTALQPMQPGEPDYNAAELATIACPVTVAHATGDEPSIPGARFVLLEGVSYFARQRPDLFSAAVPAFLCGIKLS